MHRLLQFFLAILVALASAAKMAQGLWTGRIWQPEEGWHSWVEWSAHPSAYLVTMVVLAMFLVGSAANAWSFLRKPA